MLIAIILSFSISIALWVLSIVFKIAGKARLSLPLLYILAASISTLFTDWTTQHEQLVWIGLYILLGLVVFSWIISLVNGIRQRRKDRFIEEDISWQIQQARKMGVPLDSIVFDENNSLIDPRTGNPVQYGKNPDN